MLAQIGTTHYNWSFLELRGPNVSALQYSLELIRTKDMACWRKIKVHNRNEIFKDELAGKNVLILPG